MTRDALESWRRVEEVFEAALERPAGEREAFVDAACADAPEMRERVLGLLAADEGTGILDRSEDSDGRGESRVGLRLGGRYRLLGEIGRGGSSVVHRAARDDAAYEQEVAVKILGRSLEGDASRERFRRERQILADLDHPAIARLLDGGTTPDGAPYLVLELVEGAPLTDWCDERRLDLEARLRLFLEVLDAVQYAHRNLVVHRDLKPANILVRADGTPKLLDFGIAKLLDVEGPDAPEPTRTDLLLLTPGYAAPEQLLGRPLTTATDVYSLGVVLHRLLGGARPYDVESADLETLLKVVCATDRELPSRRTGRRDLRGDLDHILLKALARDPEDRYPSAEALAADLSRHLEGLPVEARAAGRVYRAGRLVRRHRTAFAVAATVFGLIVTFAISSAFQARSLEVALRRAETESAKASAVNTFLIDLLRRADPASGEPRDLTVLEAVRQAEAALEGRPFEAPEQEAAVRHVIGSTYFTLGADDAAVSMLERAAELSRLDPEAGPTLARSLGVLGQTFLRQRDLDAAGAVLEESLEVARLHAGTPSAEVSEALGYLAGLHRQRGDFETSDRLYREAIGVAEELDPPDPDLISAARHNLATSFLDRGAYEESESLFEQALAEGIAGLGEVHPQVAATAHNLGLVRYQLGDTEGAVAALGRALDLRTRMFGEAHASIGSTLQVLANVALARGELEDAERHSRRSLEVRREVLAPDHPDLALSMIALALVRLRQGDFEGAGPLAEEARALASRVYGEDHERVVQCLDILAGVEAATGSEIAAERLYREVVTRRRRGLGPRHAGVGIGLARLADFLRERGRPADAAPLYAEALDILAEAGVGGRAAALIELGSIEAAIAEGRPGDVEDALRSFADRHHEVLRADSEAVRRAVVAVRRAFALLGRPADAEEIERTLEAMSGSEGG